jgi:hypothetical protein
MILILIILEIMKKYILILITILFFNSIFISKETEEFQDEEELQEEIKDLIKKKLSQFNIDENHVSLWHYR